MSPAQRLTLWSERWSLRASIMTCRSCKANQPEHSRLEEFLHLPNCIRLTDQDKPWDELDEVVRAVSDAK